MAEPKPPEVWLWNLLSLTRPSFIFLAHPFQFPLYLFIFWLLPSHHHDSSPSSFSLFFLSISIDVDVDPFRDPRPAPRGYRYAPPIHMHKNHPPSSNIHDLMILLFFLLVFSTAVVACNNLKDTEWISKQDPYVCLEYASSKFRTRTCTGVFFFFLKKN